MAGTIKVDSINADSNLTLKIANTAVAFIDATGLRPTSGNVSLDATATSKFYLPSANTVAIQTAGVTGLSISSSQVVTLANALPVTSGGTGVTTSTGTGANVLGTSPTITTPTISSLSSASATALTLQSAGTTAITVDTSQNVGIGTASPGVKLDVSGGDFKIQQSASTARQRFVAGSNQWNIETSNSTNGYAIYDAAAGQLRTFIDTSGNFQFNSGYGSAATAYGCRAWVNFNGGLGNTAGTINGSGNVSSITVHGTGDYTVNFTNAMPNVNYATFGGCREDNAGIGQTSNRVVNPRRDTTSITTTTCRIGVTDFGYVAQNVQLVFFSVFR